MYVYKNKSTIYKVYLMFVSVSEVAKEPGHSAKIYIINTRWKVTYLKVLPLLCIDIVNIRWEVTYTRVHSPLCYKFTEHHYHHLQFQEDITAEINIFPQTRRSLSVRKMKACVSSKWFYVSRVFFRIYKKISNFITSYYIDYASSQENINTNYILSTFRVGGIFPISPVK